VFIGYYKAVRRGVGKSHVTVFEFDRVFFLFQQQNLLLLLGALRAEAQCALRAEAHNAHETFYDMRRCRSQ
jgi:hypothetical protein